MTVFLERVDSAPVSNNDFSFEMNSWLSIFQETLNEDLNAIETFINLPYAPPYTTAEINAFAMPPDLNDPSLYLPNGTIFFDTTIAKLKVQTDVVLGVGATIETIQSV